MSNAWGKVWRNAEEIMGCLMIIVMVLAVTLGVLARLLNVSVTWTDELSRYSFIWIVYIGSVVAFKRGGHIALDFLIKLFPFPFQKLMAVFIQFAMLILLLYLLPFGVRLTLETWSVPTTSLEIPTGLVYFAVPLSFFLSAIYTARNLWRTTRNNLPVPSNHGIE